MKRISIAVLSLVIIFVYCELSSVEGTEVNQCLAKHCARCNIARPHTCHRCKRGFRFKRRGLYHRRRCVRRSNCRKYMASDCDANAKCSLVEGGYICVCNSNYYGSGKSCTSVILQSIAPDNNPEHARAVGGFTLYNNDLYVIRNPLNGPIEVYSGTNFTFQRHIDLGGLNDSKDTSYGMASSATSKCLYLSVQSKRLIYRVDLTVINNPVVTNWSTSVSEPCNPSGLSINSADNLIVACAGTTHYGIIIEYTTTGGLVREIDVADSNFIFPWHAIQLSSGKFVACHGFLNNKQRVCLIAATGELQICYGGDPGPGTGQLNYPAHLAVDSSGYIYVADSLNNRIVVLTSQLTFSRNFPLTINDPTTVYIDQTTSRLFAGEGTAPYTIFVAHI